MHIAHIIPGLGVGGAETALLNLTRHSSANGLRHSVLSMLPGGALGEQFERAGIHVTWLDFKRHPISAWWAMLRWLRQQRPDVVQTWMYHADVVGGLAARLCGIRALVWSIRQTSIDLVPASRRLRIMYRLSAWLSRGLPQTIVCNAHAARESHIAFGYGAQRMQVISNGFDGERFDPARHGRAQARELHGFAPQHLVVGHLARFSVEKDHVGFLRAAQLAVAQCPALRFMLVGREVDERNSVLARTVHELGLGDHVRMLGERSDTERCLRAMDIFCLSSLHEGCPNVLGEAMCMALPCVATDAGDARVLAGSAASIVPRADPQALAEALVGVARLTPEQREQLGSAARQRMQDEFSMQRVCRQYEDTYRAAAAAAAAVA